MSFGETGDMLQIETNHSVGGPEKDSSHASDKKLRLPKNTFSASATVCFVGPDGHSYVPWIEGLVRVKTWDFFNSFTSSRLQLAGHKASGGTPVPSKSLQIHGHMSTTSLFYTTRFHGETPTFWTHPSTASISKTTSSPEEQNIWWCGWCEWIIIK